MTSAYDRVLNFCRETESTAGGRKFFVAVSPKIFREIDEAMEPKDRFMHRRLAQAGVKNLMVGAWPVFPLVRLKDDRDLEAVNVERWGAPVQFTTLRVAK